MFERHQHSRSGTLFAVVVQHVEPLETRRLLSGVTLVTHGFNSNANDWVTAMGDQIAAQSGPLATQPLYKIKIDDNAAGGAFEVSSVQQLGAAAGQWADDEIVVLLDWSDVAGTLPFGG